MREKYLLQCVVFFLIWLSKAEFTKSLKNKNRPCKQEGPCRCVFPNGSGIDLSGLISHGFGWVPLNKTTDILYHPCVDADVIENGIITGCNSVSICLRTNSTTKNYTYISLGKANEGTFSDKIDEPPSIQFRNRQTLVLLTCGQKQDEPKLVADEKDGQYILTLTSAESCLGVLENSSKGLSTGSVLIIMFFVLSLVYFGGGMLTLKLLRGAEGKEMIPNYEFWADLPYLVRDGILFTLSGCQSSPSYDRI